MKFKLLSVLWLALMTLMSLMVQAADNQGRIVIVPITGFSDPTPVSPVGGNNALTIGAQRLEVFQRAAFIWSNILNLHYDITVEAEFKNLACSTNSATLGFAGPEQVKNIDNVWYPSAQANQLLKQDTSIDASDIYATFNSAIDSGCFSGAVEGWYYGLDNNEPNTKEALLDVVLHEIGHGLGFLTFIEDNGALFNNAIDSYSRFLQDASLSKSWAAMSNSERSLSGRNNSLLWSGTFANSAAAGGNNPLTNGYIGQANSPIQGIKLHAPSTYNSGSSVSHISVDATPDQLMEPLNTDDGVRPALEIQMFKDMGYELKAELSGNSKPVATDFTLNINTNQSINLDVLNRAIDADLDALSLYTYRVLPSNGVLSDNFDADATYTPNANFTGSDTLVYQVYDDHLQLSNEATITINVGNISLPAKPPTANDDSLNITEDSINITIDVLLNDAAGDQPLDPSTLTIENSVSNGEARVVNGKILYTPAANFFGSDSLTYFVRDSANEKSNSANLLITVTNVDDASTITADRFTLQEDSINFELDLINNDSDIDSTLSNAQVVIVSDPLHGVVTVNNGTVNYSPSADFFGSDRFLYKINVDGNESNTSAVDLEITNVNDSPVTVADQFTVTSESSRLDILLNDSDVDHNKSELTIVITSPPSHGTVATNVDSVSYQAEPDFAGEDSFSYLLRDPGDASSNVSNVNLQITQLDLPVAKKDIFVFNQNSVNQVLDLTKNDILNGEVQSIVIQQQPTNGTIAVNSKNAVFNANENAFGHSRFKYYFSDDTGLQSAVVESHIFLVNKNDAPIATDDILSIVSNVNNKLNILANDEDEELENVKINIINNPQHGDLTITSSKIFYRLNTIAQVQDGFTYLINDSQGLASNIASVTLQVVDDLPVPNVTNDEFKIKINSDKKLNILFNDQIFTDEISIEITQPTANGSLINNGKDVTYSAGSVVGEDQFNYRIQQQKDTGLVLSEEAQVSIKTLNTTPLKLTNDYAQVTGTDLLTVDLTSNDEFENIKLLTIFAHVVDGGASFELNSDGSSTIYNNQSETSEERLNELNELKKNFKIINNNLDGAERAYQIEVKFTATSDIQDTERTETLVYAIEDNSGDVKMAQVTITIMPSQESAPVDVPEQPETPELIESPIIENVEVVAIGSDAKSGGIFSTVFLLFVIVFVIYTRLGMNKSRARMEEIL